MIVIRDGDEVPQSARGGVFAIGNFDGVHRGHKALISRTVAEARGKDRPAGVIVFEPHPREFFHPEEPHFRLTPLTEKLRLLEALDLDVVVVLEFNAALAGRTAAAFIDDILVNWLDVSHVVIGYDFFFGRKRAGTPETMQLAGQDAGFGTSIVAQQAEEGEVFLVPPSIGLSSELLNQDHDAIYYEDVPRPGLRRHGDQHQQYEGPRVRPGRPGLPALRGDQR